MITHQELKGWLHYDQETGWFTWIRANGRMRAGERAGGIRGEGYRQIILQGKAYQEHRLAWLWMTGEWPPVQVDHKDTDRANNRWGNLRLATPGQNQHNTGVRADNSSGYKGVTRPRGRAKWHAYINENGRRKFLGSYLTAEEANQAAIAARQVAHGEFAR